VELAGALKEIASHSIPRDFRLIDTTTARVILVAYSDETVHLIQRKPSTRSEAKRPPFGAKRRWGFLFTLSGRFGQ
jgi:NADH dehydrogenase